jgi:branched-chain amino acid transport system substrate-binding protein
MRSMRYLTLTVLLVVAAGCTGQRVGRQEPLQVGTSLPLTGERAQLGLESRHGYEIWRDMVNGEGGLLGRPVELVVRDNRSNEQTVAADYEHLLTHDRPELLLGTQSSVLNLPASAVAERSRMLFVCPSCGSKDMFGRGFHYLFFAQPATGVHQADLFAQWVASLPPGQRPRTAAYPYLDNPFHTSVVASIKRQLELIGIKTVYHAVYPARRCGPRRNGKRTPPWSRRPWWCRWRSPWRCCSRGPWPGRWRTWSRPPGTWWTGTCRAWPPGCTMPASTWTPPRRPAS